VQLDQQPASFDDQPLGIGEQVGSQPTLVLEHVIQVGPMENLQ
jgi:hypothetical protein